MITMEKKGRKDYVKHFLEFFDNMPSPISRQVYPNGSIVYAPYPKLMDLFDDSDDKLEKDQNILRNLKNTATGSIYNPSGAYDNPLLFNDKFKLPIYSYEWEDGKYQPANPPGVDNKNPYYVKPGYYEGETGFEIVEDVETREEYLNPDYKAVLYLRRLRDVYDKSKMSEIVSFNDTEYSVDDFYEAFGDSLVPVQRDFPEMEAGEYLQYYPSSYSNYLHLNCLNPVSLVKIKNTSYKGLNVIRRIYNNLDFYVLGCFDYDNMGYNRTGLIRDDSIKVRDEFEKGYNVNTFITLCQPNRYIYSYSYNYGRYITQTTFNNSIGNIIPHETTTTSRTAGKIQLYKVGPMLGSGDSVKDLSAPNFYYKLGSTQQFLYDISSRRTFGPMDYVTSYFYNGNDDFKRFYPEAYPIYNMMRNGIDLFTPYYEDTPILDRCFEFKYDYNEGIWKLGIVCYNQKELENYLRAWEIPFEYYFKDEIKPEEPEDPDDPGEGGGGEGGGDLPSGSLTYGKVRRPMNTASSILVNKIRRPMNMGSSTLIGKVRRGMS